MFKNSLFLKRYMIGYRGLFNYRKIIRFNKIIPNIINSDAKSVLDAGCGTGTYSIFLDKLGYKVTGVDIDLERINAGKSFSKNLDLRHSSLLSLPFKDESFDLVLMSEVLEHIEDEKRALNEVSRVLKKNGLFILSVPTKKYARNFDEHNETHVRDGYDQQSLSALINPHFGIEKIKECGFLIENLIKQLDFNISKRKSSNYIEKSDNKSIKFKVYKYIMFPLIYLLLSLDSVFKTKEGLNIILISRKL